ncbi:hypothetical protein, partial [Fulvivirga kasyanovii]|uniref:hypothetical protein n=1 Tax=Fulvivirga kasyanovii TaxID=396812 RepID=UPI001C87EFDF
SACLPQGRSFSMYALARKWGGFSRCFQFGIPDISLLLRENSGKTWYNHLSPITRHSRIFVIKCDFMTALKENIWNLPDHGRVKTF